MLCAQRGLPLADLEKHLGLDRCPLVKMCMELWSFLIVHTFQKKKNIVLENGPFMDDLPVKNRDFPVRYVCLAERIRNICDEIR